MPYIVKIPKDPRLEEALQYRLQKIGEGDDFSLYEGVDVVVIPLNIGWSEAFKLFRKIKVDGGFKRLPRMEYVDGKDVPAERPAIVICPKRDRILTVRLSDDEYELLKEDAYSENYTVSAWARELVMRPVWEYLQQEKFKEAMKKAAEDIEAVCGGCVYLDGMSCKNPNIPKQYKFEVQTGRRDKCEYKVVG